MSGTDVVIDYTNHRGERAKRTIRPEAVAGRIVWFGSTEHHRESQWLLSAWDYSKQAMRTFAMKDIHSWTPISASSPE